MQPKALEKDEVKGKNQLDSFYYIAQIYLHYLSYIEVQVSVSDILILYLIVWYKIICKF